MQETVWEPVKGKYVKNQFEPYGLKTKMAFEFFRSSSNLEGSLVGDFFTMLTRWSAFWAVITIDWFKYHKNVLQAITIRNRGDLPMFK